MTTNRTGQTQRDNIKQHLKDGYSLTALEALSLFGAYRLAAHIEVLRNKHKLPIVTKMCKDVTGRTYARYSLPLSAQGLAPIAAHPLFSAMTRDGTSYPVARLGAAYHAH